MVFENRKHAASLLAPRLAHFRQENPLILALPRGGVPVAAEIASRLEIPWNVLVVRKIGAPFQSELAVGAICENDDPYMSEDSLSYTGLSPDDLDSVIKAEKSEIRRQIQKFRDGKELEKLKGRTVLLVDDGLATGNTIFAALKYLKKKGAKKIIVAVPVAAASSANRLRREADEVIAVEEREDLYAISAWYEDFSQVSDEEVLAYLHPAPSQMPLHRQEITIEDNGLQLKGNLTVVPQMQALILFAHGSGSSRLSPRNQMVAQELNHGGFGTFLFDLLTQEESEDRQKVFDIPLLAGRLVLATHFLRQRFDLLNVPFGFFGASTGAGAALLAAAQLADEEEPPFAVVSRGGRPDLAGGALEQVVSPTLLIVGARDPVVIQLNEEAQTRLKNSKLVIIPHATHLFEEEGTLEQVAKEACSWFDKHSSQNLTGGRQKTSRRRRERAHESKLPSE